MTSASRPPAVAWPSLQHAAAHFFALREAQAKVADTQRAVAAFRAGQLPLSLPDGWPVIPDASAVGRPARPRLVAPRELASRGPGSPEGRAALLHAIAHIEFNAINLAWDAVLRFPGMPDRYYADWADCADDEARHFTWLTTRLAELDYAYGDFDAHNGLWEMAERTAGSCLERMALVPRVLEARGLDVTPGMIQRLTGAGDHATVAILENILREEVAHVASGTRWFHHLCAEQGLEPRSTFLELLKRHARDVLRRPFNLEARGEAGFDAIELDALLELTEGPA